MPSVTINPLSRPLTISRPLAKADGLLRTTRALTAQRHGLPPAQPLRCVLCAACSWPRSACGTDLASLPANAI